MENSSLDIVKNPIGHNEPIEELQWFNTVHRCSVRKNWPKFDWFMASNAEFRRVVNYTDLEALLECTFVILFC